MKQTERDTKPSNNLLDNEPKSPVDDTGRELLEKHQLPSNASLSQMKPVARGLLEHGDTLLEGIQLMLGRYVGSPEVEENETLKLLFSPLIDADFRFAILSLVRNIEDKKRIEGK